ncbi:MAG: hypothetical protein AABZ08_14005 [Planctomycetota bacterium]
MITRNTESRSKRIAIACIAVAILVPASYGFAEKLILFIMAVKQDQLAGFTIVPIANYLIVTAGMMCLLIWATRHGMFRDIEKPKYDMLDREAELDDMEQQARKNEP